MATGCAGDEADGGPAAECFAGTTFLAQYDAIVALFCGPAPTSPDAGTIPADATSADATSGDATAE
jgi:hypothetical protein